MVPSLLDIQSDLFPQLPRQQDFYFWPQSSQSPDNVVVCNAVLGCVVGIIGYQALERGISDGVSYWGGICRRRISRRWISGDGRSPEWLTKVFNPLVGKTFGEDSNFDLTHWYIPLDFGNSKDGLIAVCHLRRSDRSFFSESNPRNISFIQTCIQ